MAYQSELEKLENRYKENPDQWFAALADQYRKAGSMDLALQVVRAGLEKRPNYVSGHIVLARCHLDQKNDADAATVLKRVLELDAENIMALKTLAEIAQRTADVEGERGWLGRLLEIDPQNDDAREALAKLPAAEGVEAAGPAGSAAAPPPAHEGAVEGFEATSFADVAPIEAPADVPDAEPMMEGVTAASMPALELERTDAAESAPVEMAPLDLEPRNTDLEVVEPVAAGADMPALEREDLSLSLDDGPAAPSAEPELLPLDDSAVSAGADAALGLEPEAPALEPMAPMDLEPAPMEMAMAAAPAPIPEETAAMPAGSEPAPVLTETMAEVYAKQGLLDQARGVYQQLLAQRPEDERLKRRLADLTPRESGARRRRQTAAQTGGISARAFVAGVLTGRPVTIPAPSAPSAMDTAFAEPPGGAPTMPAPNEASLASVFPDDGTPRPVERAGSGTGGGGAFSFDEFFGGRRPARPSAPRTNPTGQPGHEEDFRSWLKGLKT